MEFILLTQAKVRIDGDCNNSVRNHNWNYKDVLGICTLCGRCKSLDEPYNPFKKPKYKKWSSLNKYIIK